MVTREEVKAAALDFLKAVAERAKAQLGPNLERVQHSHWMVRSGPRSWEIKEFERKVFDQEAAYWWWHRVRAKMGTLLKERERLEALLNEAGIPRDEMRYGYLKCLVDHWLEVPDPFGFDLATIANILDEFVDAMLDGTTITRSRVALDGLDLAFGSVELEKGICVRPIMEDELWELGDTRRPLWRVRNLAELPSEDWKILNVELSHGGRQHPEERDAYFVLWDIWQAALVALRLLSSGCFRVTHSEQKAGYSVITPPPIERKQFGSGRPYVVNEEVTQRLKDSWPRLREIMESEGDYLRLPAQRLLEGGARESAEDAIMDYAKGLEALLNAGQKHKITYRFTHRGSTVLCWDDNNRLRWLKRLCEFYDVRSSIAHGSSVDQKKVSDTRSVGEDALRKIWWWYFDQNNPSLDEVTKKIDNKILE